jgi:hypothetical protein
MELSTATGALVADELNAVLTTLEGAGTSLLVAVVTPAFTLVVRFAVSTERHAVAKHCGRLVAATTGLCCFEVPRVETHRDPLSALNLLFTDHTAGA